jgi:pimeloyl-ACP methyl ester carboxylesterase
MGPGNGPPLLFLHGATRRWQSFLPLAPALQSRWKLCGLDHRGHGLSDHYPGAYQVREYVLDAECIVRDQFKEPVVLYGHSLGALVAAGVAAAAPECVRAVILEDPPAPYFVHNIRNTTYFPLFTAMRKLAGSDQPVGVLARELAAVRLPGPGGTTVRFGDVRDSVAVRFTARCLKELDPDVLTPLLEGGWLDGFDLDAALRNVRCPALLLCADEAAGGMLRRVDADRIMDLLPDGCRVDLPGVGHVIHWLATDRTAGYVLGFLESL